MPSLADAIGAGFVIVADEHLLTSFMSSPGTIRNMYVATGQDLDGVRTDLNIALALGISLSLLLALLLGSWFTAAVGIGFGTVLYFVYKSRAGL
jgi:hypothetical protein